jgi:TPR repeat protein
MNTNDTALAEGLYWYAEKLLWGYEGVEKDYNEAFRLFRQAADLGFSDAHLRVGQLHEYGKGTERDASAAW